MLVRGLLFVLLVIVLLVKGVHAELAPFDFVSDSYYCDWHSDFGGKPYCNGGPAQSVDNRIAASANAGDPRDMVLVANADFDKGDIAAAFVLLQKAAAKNQVVAMVELADLYRTGVFGRSDPASAVTLYQAVVDGAERFGGGGRVVDLARERLAAAFANGAGIAKDDVEATRLYLLAANHGDEAAMLVVGIRYANGLGVAQDGDEGLRWLRKVYDADHKTGWGQQRSAKAAFSIAVLYDKGTGVKQNYAQAFHWYRLAAEFDDFDAMIIVASMYRQGRGVEKDPEQADYWERQAARRAESNIEDVVTAQNVKAPR